MVIKRSRSHSRTQRKALNREWDVLTTTTREETTIIQHGTRTPDSQHQTDRGFDENHLGKVTKIDKSHEIISYERSQEHPLRKQTLVRDGTEFRFEGTELNIAESPTTMAGTETEFTGKTGTEATDMTQKESANETGNKSTSLKETEIMTSNKSGNEPSRESTVETGNKAPDESIMEMFGRSAVGKNPGNDVENLNISGNLSLDEAWEGLVNELNCRSLNESEGGSVSVNKIDDDSESRVHEIKNCSTNIPIQPTCDVRTKMRDASTATSESTTQDSSTQTEYFDFIGYCGVISAINDVTTSANGVTSTCDGVTSTDDGVTSSNVDVTIVTSSNSGIAPSLSQELTSSINLLVEENAKQRSNLDSGTLEVISAQLKEHADLGNKMSGAEEITDPRLVSCEGNPVDWAEDDIMAGTSNTVDVPERTESTNCDMIGMGRNEMNRNGTQRNGIDSNGREEYLLDSDGSHEQETGAEPETTCSKNIVDDQEMFELHTQSNEVEVDPEGTTDLSKITPFHLESTLDEDTSGQECIVQMENEILHREGQTSVDQELKDEAHAQMGGNLNDLQEGKRIIGLSLENRGRDQFQTTPTDQYGTGGNLCDHKKDTEVVSEETENINISHQTTAQTSFNSDDDGGDDDDLQSTDYDWQYAEQHLQNTDRHLQKCDLDMKNRDEAVLNSRDDQQNTDQGTEQGLQNIDRGQHSQESVHILQNFDQNLMTIDTDGIYRCQSLQQTERRNQDLQNADQEQNSQNANDVLQNTNRELQNTEQDSLNSDQNTQNVDIVSQKTDPETSNTIPDLLNNDLESFAIFNPDVDALNLGRTAKSSAQEEYAKLASSDNELVQNNITDPDRMFAIGTDTIARFFQDGVDQVNKIDEDYSNANLQKEDDVQENKNADLRNMNNGQEKRGDTNLQKTDDEQENDDDNLRKKDDEQENEDANLSKTNYEQENGNANLFMMDDKHEDGDTLPLKDGEHENGNILHKENEQENQNANLKKKDGEQENDANLQKKNGKQENDANLQKKDGEQENDANLQKKDGEQENDANLQKKDGEQENDANLQKKDGEQENDANLQKKDGEQENDANLQKKDGEQENDANLQKKDGEQENDANLQKKDGEQENDANLQKKDGEQENDANLQKKDGEQENDANLQKKDGEQVNEDANLADGDLQKIDAHDEDIEAIANRFVRELLENILSSPEFRPVHSNQDESTNQTDNPETRSTTSLRRDYIFDLEASAESDNDPRTRDEIEVENKISEGGSTGFDQTCEQEASAKGENDPRLGDEVEVDCHKQKELGDVNETEEPLGGTDGVECVEVKPGHGLVEGAQTSNSQESNNAFRSCSPPSLYRQVQARLTDLHQIDTFVNLPQTSHGDTGSIQTSRTHRSTFELPALEEENVIVYEFAEMISFNFKEQSAVESD